MHTKWVKKVIYLPWCTCLPCMGNVPKNKCKILHVSVLTPMTLNVCTAKNDYHYISGNYPHGGEKHALGYL